MVKIGLLGYGGRMGQLIAAEIAAHASCTLATALVRTNTGEPKKMEGVFVTSDADEAISLCDIVIDFTLAEVTAEHARLALKYRKPLMVGTTGLNAESIETLKEVSHDIAVLYAPNTSLSLAAMRHITTLAARLLGRFDYDVAILDEHHRMKKDAPSGTAKALGEAVTEGNNSTKVPSYAAIRAGYIVGNHEVAFVGQGETIRLQHSVTDRRVFARGAVEGALWLQGRMPGYFGMNDVLGI